MRTSKKLSSMALVFVLVMSSMTVPFVSFVIDEAHSFTAAPFTTTDAEGAWDIHGNEMTILYDYDAGTKEATLAGIEGGAAGLKVLNVPEEIEHKGKKYTVTGIGMMAVSSCITLTTVSLSKVTTIGEYAFTECTSLASIDMPNVVEIGHTAFASCISLTSIAAPKVTTLGDSAFFVTSSLTSVNMPEVTSIGNNTFTNCAVLTSVTLSKVTTIGEFAFSDCTSLTTADMPNVVEIGDYAFSDCTSLTTVNMPMVTSLGRGVFADCNSLTEFKAFDDTNMSYKTINGVIHSADGKDLVAFPSGKSGKYTVGDDVTTILDSAFAFSAITEVVTSNVTTIGEYAFSHCDALTTVDMPNVTTIGNRAFEYCTSLTEFKKFDENNDTYKSIDGVIHSADGTVLILFPQGRGGEYVVDEGVETIGADAFNECDLLKKIDMSNVTSIEDNAFSYCDALTTIDMPEVISIGDGAFRDCLSLTSVDMPKVTTIEDSAFRDCLSLTSVDMPNVTTIGDFAFESCSSLATVDLLNLTTMGEYAFSGCTLLTSVDMPNMTIIKREAFSFCYSLTSVNIPKVTTIMEYAFPDCHSLATVDLPSVTTVGYGAFSFCYSLTTIEMPKVTTIGERAFFKCTALIEFQDFSRNNTVFKPIDGIIYDKSGTVLVVFPAGRDGEYIVNEDVETIVNSAFAGCTLLEAVDTSNVTSIETSAFLGCTSLTTVDMPKVTSIEISAFSGCSSLTSVDIPKATTIGDWVFFGCISLTSVNMPSVTTIGDRAFRDCTALTIVDMPSVTTIGVGAFLGCTLLASINTPKATVIWDGAFEYCISLTSVHLPSVTTISVGAFLGCNSLTSVNMPSVTTIGPTAFRDCISLTIVDMPSVTTIGPTAFLGCTSLTGFQDFDKDHPSLRTIDGVIHSADGSVLALFPPGRGGEYTVGEDVTLIPAGAFSSNVLLNTLSILLKTKVETDAFVSGITTLVIYTEGTGAGDVLGSIMGVWGGYLPGASDTLETVIVDCDASSSQFDGSTHVDGVVLAFTKNAKISETKIETYFENAFTMDDLQGNAYLWNEEDGIWKQCSTDDEYEVFLKYDEKMGNVDRPVYLDQLLGLQELTFRALPNEGYEFVRWSNGSTDERLDLWVYDTTTVEAIFAPIGGTVKTVEAPLTYEDVKRDIQNVRSSLTYVVDIDDLDRLIRLTPTAMSELAGEKIIKVSVTENGKEKYSWTLKDNSGFMYLQGRGFDLLVTDDVSSEIKEKAEDVNDKDMDISYINTQQNEHTMYGLTLSYNIGKSGTYSLYVYDESFEEFVDTGKTITTVDGYATITLDDNKIYALMTETQEGGGDDDLLLYGAIAAVAIVALLGIILAWRRLRK